MQGRMRCCLTHCLAGTQKWIVGKQYPVIPGELFYMSIRNEAKLRELQDWQVIAAFRHVPCVRILGVGRVGRDS